MSWDREELREYDVRENQNLMQHEKETTMQVDKDEEMVNIHTRIGSHIRKIIKSPNDTIEVQYIQQDRNDNIYGLGAKIPVDSITVSIKKSPKKQGYISQMLLS